MHLAKKQLAVFLINQKKNMLQAADMFYDKLSFKADNRRNVKRSPRIGREHLEIMKLIGKITHYTLLNFSELVRIRIY